MLQTQHLTPTVSQHSVWKLFSFLFRSYFLVFHFWTWDFYLSLELLDLVCLLMVWSFFTWFIWRFNVSDGFTSSDGFWWFLHYQMVFTLMVSIFWRFLHLVLGFLAWFWSFFVWFFNISRWFSSLGFSASADGVSSRWFLPWFLSFITRSFCSWIFFWLYQKLLELLLSRKPF